MGSDIWNGPATVLGRDGQIYLLKNGGFYARVHPCRMQHVNNDEDTSQLSKDSSRLQNEGNSSSTSPLNNVQTSVGYRYAPNSIIETSNETVQIPVVNEEINQGSSTSNSVFGSVTSALKLPKIKSIVRYKTSPTSEWERVEIVSRGGKVKGQHWHFLNVRPLDGHGDSIKHVRFRDDVHEWKPAAPYDSNELNVTAINDSI